MKSRPPCPTSRRGAIAPLTALLLIPLLALVAFAVDIAWITHTHNELQSAADAAALAGAARLADSYITYYMPGNTDAQRQAALTSGSTAARTSARQYAGYNSAAESTSLTLLDADIELGYTSPQGAYTSLPTYTKYPNTVKVLMRRDATANGPLGTFFARIIGVNSVDLNATATAALYAGVVDGFKTTSTFRSRILPMTYDVNDWNNYLVSGTARGGTRDNTAAGTPQLNVYPSIKFTGNFGELSLDQSNAGSSTIRDWIATGISAADLKIDYTAGLLPLSTRDPNSQPDWKGNPGLKTSTIQEVGDNVGELYLLPLFKPFNSGSANGTGYAAGQGSGSNYYYNIVQFVGVVITNVDATGNNKAIKVQPTALIDPNALYTSVAPVAEVSSSTPLATTFVGAKLTR